MSLRFDSARLDSGKVQRMDNGWLRAPAALTRTGVFSYRQPDGTVRREYRPPDEVFDAESLASFALVPLTDGHPTELLTAENATGHAVGSVGENVRRDGDFVAANLLITSADVVAKVERKDALELSCGYAMDLDETPGVTPGGERYDAVQRRIRGNHVALVERGRAGPGARIRLDAADAVLVVSNSEHFEGAPSRESQRMATKVIRIDGVDFEVPEQAAQAVEKLEKRHAKRADELQAAVDATKGETDKAKARADAAEAATKKLEGEVQGFREQAKKAARSALEGQARKVLGKDARLDGLDDTAVKVAVIAKLDPKFKVEGKSAEYLAARFDIACEAEPGEVDETRADVAEPAVERYDADEEVRTDAPTAPVGTAAKSYAAHEKRMRDLWKKSPDKGEGQTKN